MRLTLRTLLAYLDEILDPHDAEQLHRKIQDSEFATALVHQIRGSIRRLRLEAPPLDAQGIGGDLNSVAEYLDNTLPPDQVPALEKVCLENEMHLGEVASCHQILTLVLGEAADVNDRMRQRAYAIASTAPSPQGVPTEARPPGEHVNLRQHRPGGELSPKSAAQEAVVTPAMATSQRAKEAEPTGHIGDPPTTKETWRKESRQGFTEEPALASSVATTDAGTTSVTLPESGPDYLRPKSSRFRSALVTLVIALLIVFGLMFATGRWQQSPLVSRWLGGEVAQPNEEGLARPRAPEAPVPTAPPDFEPSTVDAGPDPDEPEPYRTSRFQDHPSDRFVTPEPPAAESALPNLTPADGADVHVAKDTLPPELMTPVGGNDPRFADASPLEIQPDDAPLAVIPPTALPVIPEADTPRGNVDSTDPLPATENGLPGPNPPLDPAAVTVDSVDTRDQVAPEIPPGPEIPELSMARTDKPIVPAGASLTPLVDPGVDLEAAQDLAPAEIYPPVASPAIVSDAAAPDTRLLLPDDQRVPDPIEIVPSSGPAMLKADQLLLAYDGQQGDWRAVDASVALDEGRFFLCLPAFQADIEIGTSVRCSVLGATRLQFGPTSEIALRDGRLLVKNRLPNRSQALRFQDERFDIKMLEEESLVAIEAAWERLPGADLDALPHSTLRIYAVKHPVTVDVLSQSYELAEGQYLLAVDSFPPRVENAAKSPNWLSVRNSAELKTVLLWKGMLDDVDDVRGWLAERAGRRYNESSLAARCLAEIDEFGPLVSSLNNPEQRSYWDLEFESVRRALTRGSQTTAKLQSQLEEVYGVNAGTILEMIRGYNDRQLASGAAEQLVRYLDHERLDYRVLAFQNLKMITGSTQAYNPEKSAAMRRRSVETWQKRLHQGHVRYRWPAQMETLIQSFVE